jgi:3-deoxy-manno-octulosonate cytidylyltransferase (CMP-KDO synthetase)
LPHRAFGDQERKMNVIGIIPARMASSRFPGKPLVKINGIPMIGHVYYRSRMSQSLQEVYIATCDDSIREYAESIKAPCVMTADTHQRASDRAAEATLKIEQARGEKVDIVMMIQGDEPMLNPAMLDQAVLPLINDQTLHIVNLMAPITSAEEFENPNVVKVIVDLNHNALYLSREPIPSRKKTKDQGPMFKQLGLIAFRRDYLLAFYSLPATPLEKIESVDMLRVLEHGDPLKMVMTEYMSMGVDTPEDLIQVEKKMAEDPLLSQYSSLKING